MAVPKSALPKREALRHLLADGQWHHMKELRAVGGWRYGARLLELRQGVGGRALVTERRSVHGSENELEYRAFIAPCPPPPTSPALIAPRRQRAQERIEELARENKALKARVQQLEGATHA